MHRIEVRLKSHLPDPAGRGLVKDIQDLGINSVTDARVVDVYWLDANLAPEKVELIAANCWRITLPRITGMGRQPVLTIPGTAIR